jgi:hypothetical protein
MKFRTLGDLNLDLQIVQITSVIECMNFGGADEILFLCSWSESAMFDSAACLLS